MGPMKQLQKMFERGRFIATFIYLATIVLTLVAGLVLSNPPLAVLFVINQYIAMAWYSISYIPFARLVLFVVLLTLRCSAYYNFVVLVLVLFYLIALLMERV